MTDIIAHATPSQRVLLDHACNQWFEALDDARSSKTVSDLLRCRDHLKGYFSEAPCTRCALAAHNKMRTKEPPRLSGGQAGLTE
jgi:hypothetical protein